MPRRKNPSTDGRQISNDNDNISHETSSPSIINISPPNSHHAHTPQFPSPKLCLSLVLPPILLSVGLAIFTQSFFLSRTSFDYRSSCDYGSGGELLIKALGMTQEEVQFMRGEGWLSDDNNNKYDNNSKHDNTSDASGCWVSRRVDSMVILVVDALRFDFARDHLPLSIGSRLLDGEQQHKHKQQQQQQQKQQDGKNKAVGTSQLFQFVADPPTVTMQRLKGLTTGGLPTFADISGSFGGASIDEDSWVEQLKNAPWNRRRHPTPASLDGANDKNRPQIAFVGDDTWVDLFPTQFDDCHPYPSFNTRDLDTVDNGCLMHLPRLLNNLVGLEKNHELGNIKNANINTDTNNNNNNNNNASSYELVIAHFLGVDHVGHTYGPNDPHMESKLHQVDVMLANTFDTIDDAPKQSCIVALVLGDHGMTEDGNHGGGTSDEVNAGLFVHFSPGCQEEDEGELKKTLHKLDGGEVGIDSLRAFESIHQIDLVPTISLLLGLPIPYANIGGLVPSLLPAPRHTAHTSSSTTTGNTDFATPHVATALALNAAQVWSYLHTYSQTSRDLPLDRLKDLKESLDSATMIYRDALANSQKMIAKENDGSGESSDKKDYQDSMAFRQACGLFKLFLAESTDLGKRVWTQFNESGMMLGIGNMAVAWILAIPLWARNVRKEFGLLLPWNGDIKRHLKGRKILSNPSSLSQSSISFRRLELAVTLIFMIFQCAVLTFGNSYIDHEREVVTFFLSVLCLLIFRRWYFASTPHDATNPKLPKSVYIPLVVALCSRMNDVIITGHGLDPSIRLHPAHHSFAFLSSLLVLVVLRLRWLNTSSRGSNGIMYIPLPALIDIFAIICLALAWWEKRARDHSRDGFAMARAAVSFTCIGLLHSLLCIYRESKPPSLSDRQYVARWIKHTKLALFRVMMLIVIVTGPSTASTAVLILIQCAALFQMMESFGSIEIDAPVMAAIWRLTIRHAFFVTNHHCSFNRLQYSAAFVTTDTFHFAVAGSSLFLNTFGWEFIGSILVLVLSRACNITGDSTTSRPERVSVWLWFYFYQWTEMLASCLSVSVMKRHLMVWAIFAPRFMFATVFTGLGLFLWFFDSLMTNVIAPLDTMIGQSRRQIR